MSELHALKPGELAELLGCTTQTIRRAHRARELEQVRSGRYDGPRAVAWWVSRRDGRGQASSERAKLDAERRRALKHQNDVAEGLLMPVADSIAAAREAAQLAVVALEPVPGRVAGPAAEMDDPVAIARLVKEELRAARAEIAAHAGKS